LEKEGLDDHARVVEAIFCGMIRRFGEYLFSIKAQFRNVEVWLMTILWNVLIYPG
jgi:hypothetical protein